MGNKKQKLKRNTLSQWCMSIYINILKYVVISARNESEAHNKFIIDTCILYYEQYDAKLMTGVPFENHL